MDSDPVVRTGWRRLAFVVAGLLLVGCAYLGVMLPGVPTTPFLLAASYCFIRSSPRLHRWLRRSPIFGTFIRDWETHRGIRWPIKILAISMVVIVVTCSIVFSGMPIWVKVSIGCLAVVGISVILMVPTVNEQNRS